MVFKVKLKVREDSNVITTVYWWRVLVVLLQFMEAGNKDYINCLAPLVMNCYHNFVAHLRSFHGV
jgi:hypothetical protein